MLCITRTEVGESVLELVNKLDQVGVHGSSPQIRRSIYSGIYPTSERGGPIGGGCRPEDLDEVTGACKVGIMTSPKV